MFWKPVAWNLGKNSKLKEERGVSFEEVYDRLQNGNFTLAKNLSINHPGQKMFVVSINRRRYAVPFTEYDEHIYLRTIYEV